MFVISSFALGVVVPMPTLPEVARKIEEVALCTFVELKYANWPVVPVMLCPPTQVPLMEKHPAVRLRPLANVEVAEVEVMLRAVV